jgi:formylmethanofuran dehydrogenase subunit A
VGERFGTLDEQGTQYIIAPQDMVAANRELNDLFNLEQELNIHIFKLDDFDGIELTYQQMSAIMFMVEE